MIRILATAQLVLPVLSMAIDPLCPRDSGSVPYVENGVYYGCKCSPADACWPTVVDWQTLNATVGGNLLRHIPPAAVCHTEFQGIPTYDAAKCQEATANWGNEYWHIEQPASQLWPWGSNNTCVLTTNPSEPCTLGNYPEYVIMAKTKGHVQAGVDFARTRDLRLVIRNTGHDFEGRSAGAGSLAINTHSFQDITFIDAYSGAGTYQGRAVTIGAGVQGYKILDAAFARNPPQTVVTGECTTVGIAGGFIQGGGHGPLSNLYGFAADQALAFEVLTADGRILVANADSNSDLFWALKGGGPGNYGVVLSVTMKTYPDNMRSAAMFININGTMTTDFNVILKALHKLHNMANYIVDNGLYGIYELYPPAIGGGLHVQPIMGINMTGAQLDAIMKPLFDYFDAEGIPYDTGTKEFETYYELFHDMLEPEASGQNVLTGGWVFTHEDLDNRADQIEDAVNLAIFPRADLFTIVVSHFFDPGHTKKTPESATHPSWRKASMRLMAILPQSEHATWEQKLDYNDVMVNTITAAFQAAAPNGLAYVNENYAFMHNWQDAFWGPVYSNLAAIKAKWDPAGVFYSWSTPGTEMWSVVDYAKRLCKRL